MRVEELLEEFGQDVKAALLTFEKPKRCSLNLQEIHRMGLRKLRVKSFITKSHWRLIRNQQD